MLPNQVNFEDDPANKHFSGEGGGNGNGGGMDGNEYMQSQR